ncbi:hypothetical protein CRM22_006090 [Opisthorchis felineus]|uniref:SGS domain-containing protein n=2 Tax=Opisthorchiidae TaxID=6196 RepID=A0A4S2LU02_OPIFE|nr:hypothetical protein CRM22_006090 [Opisthorchis felineus]
MSASGDKFDWYQSDRDVTINYLRKNLKPSDVRVDFDNQSAALFLLTPAGDELLKRFQLSHPIIPEQSSFRVSSMKIEVCVRKQTEIRWTQLEDVSTTDSVSKVAHSYPSSSKVAHDWNKLEKEAAELEDDGDPLNKLFQSIYRDASDETRRAMIKSFTESGGTVLSTNWDEVGKGKVEMKPPDGMEYKKYEL